MKIYESLISLAMSSNETDHELFHMYHSLEDKLDSLDWFFQEKIHGLPMETYGLDKTFELCTNLIFQRTIVEILPGAERYYYCDSPGPHYCNGEELIPINSLDDVKGYLTTLISNEHNKRHTKETN